MKNFKVWVAMFMATSYIFTACSDDDSSNKEVFSELTPQEHKEELEDEGVKFVDQMSDVANLNSFDIFDQLSKNMDISDPFEDESAALVEGLIEQVEELKNGPKVVIDLKSYSGNEGEESVTAMFAEVAGVYTWNSNNSNWDFTESATELTLNFMVDGTKQAKISISEFLFSEFDSPVGDGSIIELPTSVKMAVTLDEVILCSLSLSGSYYEDGMPKLVNETITLEGFTYKSTLDLSSKSKLSTSTSFDYYEDVIFATGVTVAGDIDFDAISEEMDSESEESMDDTFSQQIIDNANAYFQLGNIKAEGLVNFVGMSDDMEKLTEETATEESFLVIMNDNVKTYIRYADSKEIIAKSEFYMNEKIYTYSYWDYEQDKQVEVTETDTFMDIKMVFADGSQVSGEFFDNGFGEMIDEINDLIGELNANYDMELEVIE